jgi:nitrate/nitrite transporter NarK
MWALYLTRQVHLSPAHAGLAMTVAGLIGFLAPIPLGRHADRHGPREVYRLLLILEAIARLGHVARRGDRLGVAVCSQGRVGATTLTSASRFESRPPPHARIVGRITHGISRAVIRFVAPAAPV